MKIHDWNPDDGDALQGDVCLFRLPEHVKVDTSDEIAPEPLSGSPISEPAEFAVRVRELLDYDPMSGRFTWRVDMGGTAKAGSEAGCINSAGYVLIKVDGQKYQASRLAWLHVHGRWPNACVDHIDGVRANNAIENLREATRIQNRHNSAVPSNSVSGVKGVFWNSKRSKWQARICLDADHRQHLGYFDELDAAAAAYASAEKFYRGEFAAANSRLILASGELTGHHHAIWDRNPPTMFREDGGGAGPSEAATATMIKAATAAKTGTAKLYRDPKAIAALMKSGELTTDALAIGILVVEKKPVVLRHDEHDAIRIPPGRYYVGGQMEWSAADARRVAD